MKARQEQTIKESFLRSGAPSLRDRRGEKLIHFLHEYIWNVPRKPLLDLGCAGGETLHFAAEKNLIEKHGHIGVDISRSMIEKAHSSYPELAEWIVADMEELPLADKSVAGIISNSSLQWLASPVLATLPGRAFLEMRRVLSRGAPLALVVPGRSLPSPFLDSYNTVYRDEPAWHTDFSFASDPFPSLEIADVLRLLGENSFLTLFAETTYETFTYGNAEEYLFELEMFSRSFLLLPFAEHKKEEAWQEISEDFLENVDSGKYQHHSLATYLVARAL